MHPIETEANTDSALHGLGLNDTSISNVENITNSSNEPMQTDINLPEKVYTYMLIIVIMIIYY